MIPDRNSTIDPKSVAIESVYEWLTNRSTADSKSADRDSIWVSCVSPASHNNGDSNPSLKLNLRDKVFFCFGCGIKGGVTDLIIASGHHTDATGPNDRTKAMNWLRENSRLGHTTSPAEPTTPRKRTKKKYERLENEVFEALHTYADVDGTVSHWVVRLRGLRKGKSAKTFEYFTPVPRPESSGREWRIDDHAYYDEYGVRVFSLRAIGGRRNKAGYIRFEWVMPNGEIRHIEKNRRNAKPLPYRLPELVGAARAGRVVFVIEGERKADFFAELGFAVASFPSGSSYHVPDSWRDYFRGASAIIFPTDADKVGRAAALIRQAQFSSVAPSYVLDTWPERDDGWDYKDEILKRRAGGEEDRVLASEIRELVRKLIKPTLKRNRENSHFLPAIAPTIDEPYVAIQALNGGPIRVKPLAQWERQIQYRFRVTEPMSRELAENVTSDYDGWLTPKDMRTHLPRNVTRNRRTTIRRS